jgi:hypothetical protein
MNDEVKKMLSIHLTDLCNNKCIFCIVDSPSQKKNQVSKERVVSFLEEHANQDYSAVNLHGGESTTRTDFLEILAKIQALGYPETILQTNGRKLSKSEYANRVVELGVTKFVVSIHGSTPEVHDAITCVPGSLLHAVRGIKNVKLLGCHVRTNSVLSSLNYRDFPAIMNLLVKLNVSALHTAGAAYKNFDAVTPTYAEVFPYLEECARIVSSSGVALTLEGFPFCMISGMEQFVIDWKSQKFKMLFREFVLDDYETYMDNSMRIYGPPCEGCSKVPDCGGVYKEYIEKKGWNEFGLAVKKENPNALT